MMPTDYTQPLVLARQRSLLMEIDRRQALARGRGDYGSSRQLESVWWLTKDANTLEMVIVIEDELLRWS